jgi:hypothetical protein
LDGDGNAVTKYLVKWESTPYNESTWELATDIKVLDGCFDRSSALSCTHAWHGGVVAIG